MTCKCIASLPFSVWMTRVSWLDWYDNVLRFLMILHSIGFAAFVAYMGLFIAAYFPVVAVGSRSWG